MSIRNVPDFIAFFKAKPGVMAGYGLACAGIGALLLGFLLFIG